MVDWAGRAAEAMTAGRWDDAVAAFEELLRASDDVAAWEGLAVAARWSGDLARAVTARERAYQLYRGLGDDQSAARVAALLALDVVESSGASIVAGGWLARARDLLRAYPGSIWHAVVDGIEGAVAGVYQRDFSRAQHLLASSAAAARASGDLDSEMLASAQLGLVLVLSGEVERGLGLLDGAAVAAVAGEVSQPGTAVGVCCLMTVACLTIRDLARAEQWSDYAMRLAAERGGGRLFDYPRTDRAGLLVWRGEYEAAEAELWRVLHEARGWSRPVALAHLAFADLAERRGDLQQAAAHLDVLEQGADAGLQPLRLAVRARLALRAGRPGDAARLAETALESVTEDDVMVRVEPLEVLVRARATLGQRELAEAATAQLRASADRIGTPAMRGAVYAASAVVAEMDDIATAAERWRRAGQQFRAAGALREVAASEDELARCTALLDADRSGRPDLGLTRRETEILGLVARGMSNDQIADRLVLSVRTVEQHLANLYPKIGVAGRTARVAATRFAHRHGLVDL